MATYQKNQLIVQALSAVYPMYAVGALYVVYPVFAWYLFARVFLARLRHDTFVVHPLITLWLISMVAMLIVLIVGHIDWEVGLVATIKSIVGWAKGWALIALFLFAGCVLSDREALVKAACTVGKWTLYVTPALVIASVLRLPDTLYVSPLKVIGGSTIEYFSVSLFEVDPGFGISRFRFFAPWAPAIGLIGNVLLLLCMQEKDKKIRFYGVMGCGLMVALSLSRLGWIVAVVVPLFLCVWSRSTRTGLWFIGALSFVLFALIGSELIYTLVSGWEDLKSARSDSTVVRQYLADIALSRWWDEAPLWGHGRVEAGPHLVAYMMIGSHHTWYGLLFVKGAAGALALAVPLLTTLFVLARHAINCPEATTAFGIMCVLAMYSFGENLEVLAYLYWPGLIYVGSVLQSKARPHD